MANCLNSASWGMSLHPFGFDLASVGLFISLSFGSAVTMHRMDCFSQNIPRR